MIWGQEFSETDLDIFFPNSPTNGIKSILNDGVLDILATLALNDGSICDGSLLYP